MTNNVYSVEQINKYIRNMVEQDFFLKSVRVQGEVSNCTYNNSGHIYFTLKDGASEIKCVMFAGKRVKGLDFRLTDGQAIIVTGAVSVYLQKGQYQLYVDKIVTVGAGSLYEEFARLKEELEELGMFAPEYKKEIPKNAKTIGVVTASTGAAVRDIINVSKRRNPYIQIIVYSAAVQGKDAAPSIIKGIKALEKYGVDLMIVGRGGGSIEDLWAFNERSVAQAIFDCSIPIISAVGHEVDFTIADFVADKRAATPSAAAELAVREYRELQQQIDDRDDELSEAMLRAIRNKREQVAGRLRQLSILSPEARLRRSRERVTGLSDRLTAAFEKILLNRKHRLMLSASRLEGLSPLKRLESGYAYVADEDNHRIVSVGQVNVNDRVTMTLSDGQIEAVVTDISKKNIN